MRTPPSPASAKPPFYAPLRLARLWLTLLWALTLGVGLGAWHWAEQRWSAAAQSRLMILLPEGELNEDQRGEVRRRITREPGVGTAFWRAPAELAHELAGRFPEDQWAALFPADDPALPWLLEVQPADPLGQPDQVQAFIARRKQEGQWRLILWDGAALAAARAARGQLRLVLGLTLALAALAGAAGLAALPWPRAGGAALATWSSALGTLGPLVVWLAAQQAVETVGLAELAIGAGAGFILATVLAPMLRQRPSKESIRLLLSEAPHERLQ